MEYKRLAPDFIWLESINSTNNYAAQLLKEGKTQNGTTILTKRQTAGRGQRGNSWQAEPGLNLTFSVVVYPDMDVKHVFFLNMVVSLAVSKALEVYYPGPVSVKWPNDIYVGTHKIAGILVENQFRGERIVSSVLGIGINVNQENFGPDLRATSLRLLTGKNESLEAVFQTCFEQLDFYLNLLMDQQFALLSKQYHEKLLGVGQRMEFEDETGVFEGVIVGVDEDGKLKIKRTDGIRKYELKAVKFLF